MSDILIPGVQCWWKLFISVILQRAKDLLIKKEEMTWRFAQHSDRLWWVPQCYSWLNASNYLCYCCLFPVPGLVNFNNCDYPYTRYLDWVQCPESGYPESGVRVLGVRCPESGVRVVRVTGFYPVYPGYLSVRPVVRVAGFVSTNMI